MNFKRFVQDYFTFSRNERKGITVLLILIFLMGIANKVIFYFETPARIEVNLLDSASHKLGSYSDSLNKELSPKKLFSFNPNTIDSASLDSLDLPLQVKTNLLKFRNKNGRIYSSSDFKKIYGVTDAIYLKVEPYLIVESTKKASVAFSGKQELFQFDPNKTSDSDFRRLGLSEKQIATIRNYLDKGGSFRTKDDFFKIWGLSDRQKIILADYIAIEEKTIIVPEKKVSKEILLVELNTADSIVLKQLPGIGDKLSKRIVKYRDILGGYYSLSQLQEVYGLNAQTIHGIESMVSIDTTKIRKLDINFADMRELSKHPYIQKNLADKIIKFRTTYGSIHELSILRENMILNIDEYNRLKPYF
jgi:DNA uptake protein ComE-like DNA-binding protein